MKKLVFILVLSFLALNSCDDFLTEVPKDEISVDQLLNTPEGARGLVNGLYRDGQGAGFYDSGGFGGADVMMGGYMSGYFDNEGKGERIQGQVAQDLQVDPEVLNQFFDGWWSGHYDVIGRANTALKYIPDMEGMAQDEKNRLLAEARFFRALNYFALVKFFGDVPLITEPTESLEGIEVERDPSSAVYEQIVEDLNWAVNNGGLANVPFPENNYRVTQGAVQTLLADVYLQMSGFPLQADNYGNAADAARSVIQSGQHRLLEHGSTPEESAYNKFRISDTDDEFVYGIEYNADIDPNDNPRITVPGVIRPPGISYGRTLNAYRPIEEFSWMYDPNMDLRIQEKQLYYTSLEREGEQFDFGEWAPYLWYEEEALFETGRGSRDIRVYRYAEVLLIAAEAIARSEGVTSEAVQYLADVRDRAYWQTDRSTIVASLSGLSEQQFVEEVWKERLRELALNFKIWSDIQRTRQYPVTSENNPGEITFVDVVGASNNWGQTYEEHHLLYPIPDDEIQTNPALEQNPGYN
ncbi:RagB/SusD family nutrient uptake outer membrane protein [Halalkalibaculum sp. DA3122]|uniref:RagB/SusD family nutrient uptake outer membrane protein n=1 Tax=unclassified Halalkalibaculum TaxID=2964617 RepID=UPI003754CD88